MFHFITIRNLINILTISVILLTTSVVVEPYDTAKEADKNAIINVGRSLAESENKLNEDDYAGKDDKIKFSDRWWRVRKCAGYPGDNLFSNSSRCVWVDRNGYLHLKINKIGEKWHCAEVVLQENLGYGRYIFLLDADTGRLDKDIVTGLFIYEKKAPAAEHFREIDIEISKCLPGERKKYDDNTAQYVVQKGREGDSLQYYKRFGISLNDTLTTHYFDWYKDHIFFRSINGHDLTHENDTEYFINEWKYDVPDFVPNQGKEQVILNLWLNFVDRPYSENSEHEIIVREFRHEKH